jgi:thymidylate synthase
MNHPDFEDKLLGLYSNILTNGAVKEDRTNTGTVSLFGQMIDADISGNRLALLTSKEMLYDTFIKENCWFLSGSTNVGFLKQHGVSIWDDWVIPGTAIFLECDNPTGQDMLTYLRCYHPEKYAKWKPYKTENKIGQAKRAEVKAFYDLIGQPVANLKLSSGSIGDGAYGSAWRNWEDTRVVFKHEVYSYEQRGFEIVGRMEGTGKYVVRRSVDQFAEAIKLLKNSPDSRRIIVSAWNAARIDEAVLPPCHSFFQFYTRVMTLQERFIHAHDHMGLKCLTTEDLELNNVPRRALSLMIVCRSQDTPVGSPFNIGQYSALAHTVAKVVGMTAERLVWVGGDCHIYADQIDLVKEQLTRSTYEKTAKLIIDDSVVSIDNLSPDQFKVVDYDKFHPRINYPVAV